MATTETHLSVKFFVDKKKRRFLFMEADNKFVDVKQKPLGTIVRLIGKTQSGPSTLGCFTTLHQSVMDLGDEHFCAEGVKDMLLHPRSACEVQCRGLKINIDDTEPNYFLCSDYQNNCFSLKSLYKNTRCTKCARNLMSQVEQYASQHIPGSQVFVTESFKYIITDDLQVTPVVPGTVIGLLDSLGSVDFSVIEELGVKFGLTEFLGLLKWTFLSTTPLTDLLFKKMNQPSLQMSHYVDHPPLDWQIDVKVVLRKSSKAFLFVEARQDFIDLLFSFLIGPVGEMLHIMDGQSCVGSLDKLYKSVQSLDSQYYITENQKNILLKQKVASHFEYRSYLGYYNQYAKAMPVHSLWDVAGGSGCVRNGVFFVFDNLTVTPHSAASAISFYKIVNVSFSDLEERTVSIGAKEGLSILRASLNSSSAISNGLLRNNLIFKEPKQEK